MCIKVVSDFYELAVRARRKFLSGFYGESYVTGI